MKRSIGLLVTTFFLAAAAIVAAKDYQVTGPVVEVKDDVIVIKKGTETWEIARNKDTKTGGEIKKGDPVTIKYKMLATSIEGKTTKAKDTKIKETKVKAEEKKDAKH